MSKKTFYVGVWTHRHGTDVLPITTEGRYPRPEDFVLAYPNADFELERDDEWLDIEPLELEDVPHMEGD